MHWENLIVILNHVVGDLSEEVGAHGNEIAHADLAQADTKIDDIVACPNSFVCPCSLNYKILEVMTE